MSILNSFFKKYPEEKSGKPSKDPVCGMKPTDNISSVYAGITYKFCSDHCKWQFEEDPSAYI
jgi:YHS domain-containing protein